MRKIPTLFLRDKENPKRVTDQLDPEAAWVVEGVGVATPKFDGTCCAILPGEEDTRDVGLYRRHRHDAKKGDPPAGWRHWDDDPEVQSGHGWLPVSASSPADVYHLEAWERFSLRVVGLVGGPRAQAMLVGTYELVGPRVQGNPHRLSEHHLWRHGLHFIASDPATFSHEDLRAWLATIPEEGVVWHHRDGRMVKLKRRDLGLPWPVPQ